MHCIIELMRRTIHRSSAAFGLRALFSLSFPVSTDANSLFQADD